MTLNKNQIRNRVIFVGDRIAFGVLISLGFLILIFSFFFVFEDGLMIHPWVFLFLGLDALMFFLFYVITNEEFYYVERIFMNSNFLFVELIWMNFTLLIALSLSFIYGWQHILEMTIWYLAIYLTGYIIARIIWKNWEKMAKKWKASLITALILIVLTITISIGTMFLVNQNIRYGVISYVVGIGILISIGLNALMLQLFLDKSGNDVLEDPPSKLVIIGIINTLIISFISWFIMVIFIPIIPASKKGRSSKISYPKGASSSHRRRIFVGYRRRRYVFFGPTIEEHHKYSVSHYWDIALTQKELRDPVAQSQVEEAKQKIIDILCEEEVVPTSKDLHMLVGFPHLIFDAALDELKDEHKIKYHLRAKSNWWERGYTITGEYYSKLDRKGEISTVDINEETISLFLEKIKEEVPIRSKYKLWEIGNEIGIRPRWKITPTINKLRKERKIKYSRKKPIGW
ncbi:MAG: hypothetical protein ACFFBC_02500, partial [Promethearchaeota archaeon]